MSQPFKKKRIRIGFIPKYNIEKIYSYNKKFNFPNSKENNERMNVSNNNNNDDNQNNNNDSLSLSIIPRINELNYPIEIQDYLDNGIYTLSKRSYHIIMTNKVDYEHNLRYVRGLKESYNFYICFFDADLNWHIQVQGDNNRTFTLKEMAQCTFDAPIEGTPGYNFIRNLMIKNYLFDIDIRSKINFGRGIHGRPIENLLEEIKNYFLNKGREI